MAQIITPNFRNPINGGDEAQHVVDGFKLSMRLLAATVTIVTTVHEGRRNGLTATAACSLSRELAEVFAGATGKEGEAKFSAGGVWHAEEGGAPMLADSLASIDCEVVNRAEMGTHTIFIGLVRKVEISPDKRPLLYANRQFVGLAA